MTLIARFRTWPDEPEPPRGCSLCGGSGHYRPSHREFQQSNEQFWAECWRNITPHIRRFDSLTEGRLIVIDGRVASLAERLALSA